MVSTIFLLLCEAHFVECCTKSRLYLITLISTLARSEMQRLKVSSNVPPLTYTDHMLLSSFKARIILLVWYRHPAHSLSHFVRLSILLLKVQMTLDTCYGSTEDNNSNVCQLEMIDPFSIHVPSFLLLPPLHHQAGSGTIPCPCDHILDPCYFHLVRNDRLPCDITSNDQETLKIHGYTYVAVTCCNNW